MSCPTRSYTAASLRAELADYGSQGVFMAMNDIIEEHGYYTKQVFEQQGRAAGRLHCAGRQHLHSARHQRVLSLLLLYARMDQPDLAGQLGLEYPNTLDELCEVLRAFRDDDPTATAYRTKSDDRRFHQLEASVYPFLLNSFLHYDTSNPVGEGRRHRHIHPHPGGVQGRPQVHRRHDRGSLIEKEALTQTGEQLMTKGSGGDVSQIGVFTAATWWTALPQDTGEGSRCREYDASAAGRPRGRALIPVVGHRL